MKRSESLQIVIAESSFIVRNGLAHALKHHMADFNAHVLEVTSVESLNSYFQTHKPDILIVNPSFGRNFNLKEFKAQYPKAETKFVALLCTIADMYLAKEYDESIALYDEVEQINDKLMKLAHVEEDEEETEGHEVLSQREKEIIRCVVKGMTNKEIAEKLFISIHTVITHRRNITRKLQIHSPAGLTIYAIVNKLVELSEVRI